MSGQRTRPPVILAIDSGDPPSKLAIVRAALARFVHHGIEATSIRDLAEETGYTNPALYKFWQSKDALVLDVFERCYRQLVRHLDGAWTDDTPPLRAFDACCLVEERETRPWSHDQHRRRVQPTAYVQGKAVHARDHAAPPTTRPRISSSGSRKQAAGRGKSPK